jgi:hypothetical protein
MIPQNHPLDSLKTQNLLRTTVKAKALQIHGGAIA